MSEDERVQDALAAHLEHLEVGGPEPDMSHLSAAELGQLRELIELLDETRGIALDHDDEDRAEPSVSTPAGARVVAALRDALVAPARVTSDPAAAMVRLHEVNVAEGWIVGTFGGRVRVWLLADDGALASSERWLRELGRVFRLFPETSALALVEPDLSCLLVLPEDCAPVIEVPRGSLVGRRYRRPIHPVGDAVSVFLKELMPYWEPMRSFEEGGGGTTMVDVPPLASEQAERAIAEQVTAGGRARKTNPKRTALTGLGEHDVAELAELAIHLHDGRAQPDDVEETLRRLATNR